LTGWTAIVPIKAGGTRKTRLAAHLCSDGREQLSETLFGHVVDVLKQCPSVSKVVIVSETAPPMAGVLWIADEGRGLNPELEQARAGYQTPLLIIHADLPLLEISDVEALIAAAGKGIAIAPDRHLLGTNALALGSAAPFRLCFGPNSFAQHQAQAPEAAIISGRPGLGLDVDIVDDLDDAKKLGFRSP
jgi:2-phospho-L-lactate/phosphoenolpyruvate guanylyltransferase